MEEYRIRVLARPLLAMAALAALASGATNPRAVSLTVTPPMAAMQADMTRQFTATVQNAANPAVRWFINDVEGGNATLGTISATGLYRAPTHSPQVLLRVRAVSVADPSVSATASAYVWPVVVVISPDRGVLAPGGRLQFGLTVFNHSNKQVNWFVNDVAGGNAAVGTISTAGLYEAPAGLTAPLSARIKAVSAVDRQAAGQATINVTPAAGISVDVRPSSVSVRAGDSRQFSATVNRSSNQRVVWYVNETPGGDAVVGTVTAAGLYRAPARVPNPAVVMVKAVSVADNTAMDRASVTILPPPEITVNVTPRMATVRTGASRDFNADVDNAANDRVSWFVNNVAGGNATVGTINAAGLYTAPASLPNPSMVTVKAVSVADTSKFDTAAVMITAPTVNVTPASASVQTGATRQFSSNTSVNWFVNDVAGGNATIGTINAAGLYTAPAAVPSPAVVTVKGVSTTDTTKFDTAAVTITAAITVTITPDTASVTTGAAKQFSSNTPVNWFVNDVAGGNSTLGTINAAGLYTAPAAVPSPAVVTVKGVSTTDTTKFDTAAVTVTAALTVTVTPDTASVPTGTTRQFTSNTPVNWFVNDVAGGNATVGTINAAGLYTAPAAVPSPAAVTVKGVSTTDTTKSDTAAVTITAAITVTVTPDTASVPTGTTKQFSSNTPVNWFVNDVAGGNSTVGTINAAGLYTAPATVPSPATITVKAVSAADTSVSDTATITIQSGTSTGPSVTPTIVQPGAVTFTVRGTGFVPSTTAKFAGVDAAVTVVSPTELRVTATTPTGKLGDMVLIVRNPSPAPVIFPFRIEVRSYTGSPRLSYADAHRFLRKATFGPTPEAVDRLQAIGIDAWLTEQFAGSTPDAYPTSLEAQGSLEPLQERFMRLAITAPEQLRLKMAWVLSQIFVVSGVEITRADEMVPYQRMLYTGAFENFATTLRNVTLNAAMGEYLDNVNNGKADPARGSVPNENFARESMQLFTIGVHKLQPNGAPILNSAGVPDPTYNQDIVIALSRALTGWTFTDGRAGAPVDWQPENYSGPMEAVERYHDTGEKILMNGFRIPAGQTAEQDLTMALDHLFRHPNVGPFIGRLLIQHFVTSNPSGAYIERVANVFSNNGSGVRGDMRAVLRQVLTDPEATGAPGPEFGRLREPVALMAAQLRPLRPVISDYPFTTDLAADMGQRIFFAPSVFNYFSPNFRPAGVPLFAPEFQLLNTATALQRANFSSSLVLGNFAGSLQFDYSPFIDGAEDPALLVELIDRAYFGGTASANVKTAVTDAVRQILATNPDMRTRLALYLMLSSTQFQVER